MASLVAMLARRALSHEGGLSLDSTSLDSIRTQEGREAFLHEVMVTMMPDRINPMMWMKWLQGSAAPFENVPLRRPNTGTEYVSKALVRGAKRVSARVSAVERARAELEAAEAALAAERAFDAAVVEHAVSEHFMAIMAPMFAMGPAWVVMRALSGHVPDSEIAEVLRSERDPTRRRRREQAMRAERQSETDALMDALDYWGGDVEFEHEVRAAVASVAARYKGRVRPDAKRRTRASMRDMVADPETRREEDGILGGMPGGRGPKA